MLLRTGYVLYYDNKAPPKWIATFSTGREYGTLAVWAVEPWGWRLHTVASRNAIPRGRFDEGAVRNSASEIAEPWCLDQAQLSGRCPSSHERSINHQVLEVNRIKATKYLHAISPHQTSIIWPVSIESCRFRHALTFVLYWVHSIIVKYIFFLMHAPVHTYLRHVQQHYIITFMMLWQSIGIIWRFWWKCPVCIFSLRNASRSWQRT